MERHNVAFNTVAVAVLLPLVGFFVAPTIWRAVGWVLGCYLRKKTEGRRVCIVEAMEADQKAFALKSSSKKTGDDEEWENIESATTGSSKNGGKGEKEWDGIVGFFHPFW